MSGKTLDYAYQGFNFGAVEILLAAGSIQDRLADAWINRIVNAFPPGAGVPAPIQDRMEVFHERIHGGETDARVAVRKMENDEAIELVREVFRIDDDLATAVTQRDLVGDNDGGTRG